jgi:hypothetical protein
MGTQDWKKRLEDDRKQKTTFFAAHSESPLPLEERFVFHGLSYWPIDPHYRFEIKLREFSRKECIEVENSKGGHQRLWGWGEFRFEIDGKQCTLRAYKSDLDEDRLFVPFRDKTCGAESHSAGRYLDLEPEKHLITGNKWILDFNEAYNPWCAYSDKYVCPFVPPENWLEVAIRAGEKKYRPSKK